MTIKALIPVRSGSVRVQNKNIRPFAGSTLLEIKIKQMQRIKELDGVVVNSNSDEMLEIAARLGAETVKRDEYFASNSVSMNDVYKNMAETFPADVVVYANCTSPCMSDSTYSTAINTFLTMPKEYDSLISVSKLKEFLWKDGKPFNYDLEHQPRSQDLPENFILLNYGVHVLKKEVMKSCKSIIGKQPYLFPIEKVDAIDIDDQLDFDFAEFMYRRIYNGN